MRVFVTGSNGYLGSMLTPELMRRGHEVLGLDTRFYSDRALYLDGASVPMTVVRDLRLLEQKDLEGLDAIIHTAELSNDPLGELAPNITYDDQPSRLRAISGTRKTGRRPAVHIHVLV